MPMVICNRQPLGNILARQPGNPGALGKGEWYKPPQTSIRAPQVTLANPCKEPGSGRGAPKTELRCTYCGHIGHERV